MFSPKRIALPLALISTLSACSKVDDMHDATMAMNGQTNSIANTSERMRGVMSEIFDTGRQGASLDLRTKHYELLLSSPKLEDKALYAAAYFMAFEFQLWTNLGVDNQSGQRDQLMRDAADEFFQRLKGITHWDNVDPFALTNPFSYETNQNERASFNALAATLDRDNRKQEAATAKSGDENLNMLSMIETALRAGQQIKQGRARLEDFPAYVDVILQNEVIAKRLLEARYQFLGLAVLSDLTPITKNLVEGFKYKIWGKEWELDFSKLNESKLRLVTYRLREARRAKLILAELGEQVDLDPSIKKIYRRAHLTNANSVGMKAQDQEQDQTSPRASLTRAEAGFLNAAADYLEEPLLP